MTAAAVWERRLARENLRPIDRELAHGGRTWRSTTRKANPTAAEAVKEWLAWAQDVLRSHKFDTPWQRRVWSVYAQGRRLSEVATKLQASKRAVTRALERVKKWAPPEPVENPWRKAGTVSPLGRSREDYVRALLLQTNRRVTVRICMLALSCADKGKLREIFAADPQLLQLMPPDELEDTMAAGKPMQYTRIELKRDVTVRNPRVGADRRRAFLNVEGRPHAGGIDVELETFAGDRERSPTRTTITVPWDGIMQADRVEPEKAAEE